MFSAALALAAGTAVRGQQPAELVTDRPDQTESALVVPVGTLQAETGAFASREESGGERVDVVEAPGTLLRWGWRRRWELRAAWPGWIEAERRIGGSSSRVSGAGDPEVGFKWAIGSEVGPWPDLALLAHLSLPAGDDRVGSPRADPSIRIAAGHTLGAVTGLGWNLGIEWSSVEEPESDVDTLARWVWTLALGFELGERWGAYVELFGDAPASDSAGSSMSIDAGLTRLLTPRLQLDLAAGAGLVGEAVDRFVLVGASVRVPR